MSQKNISLSVGPKARTTSHSSTFLQTYGWPQAWPVPILDHQTNQIGRVISAHRTCWDVMTEIGFYQSSIAGHFHTGPVLERPVVGDWVTVCPDGHGAATIIKVLSRHSLLRRVAAGGNNGDQAVAANIDTVFIVGGLDGDHKHQRLRRYLALVRGGGADPVVLLNKLDQASDPEGAMAELAGIDPDVPIHLLSAKDGTHLDRLDTYLQPRKTIALLGSSGVGKSTLVNRLFGYDCVATAAVREDDSRGRHTTTNRELMPHPSGAVIMDTPGMRELALSSDASDLNAGFSDISDYATACRFRDCTHQGEPGCAVQAAIDQGKLQEGHLQDFKKLERESFIDSERRHERNARMKQFGKMVKNAKKHKGLW